MLMSSTLLAAPVPVAPKPHVAMGGAPRGGAVVIECSSRPTKKATAHHRKTRPRKSQLWDIKRKPTVYAPLPKLPPDWTLLTDDTLPPPPVTQASPEVAAPAEVTA